MEIRITKDFLSSFSQMDKQSQKNIKETIFQITNSETAKGLRFHKINHQSNKVFSYSVNQDIRIIAHVDDSYHTLLYVDHHDKAYGWIIKRKIFIDRFDNIKILVTSEEYDDKVNKHFVRPINQYNNSESLSKYKDQINNITNDDDAINFISQLPYDIQDPLMDYLVNNSHHHHYLPDFNIQVISDDKELEQALTYPLELWRIFLHTNQKSIINCDINKSLFITGGPGTGKTVCLIHRIKYLTNFIHNGEIILLSTYKENLMIYLHNMIKMLSIDEDKYVIDDISKLTYLKEKPKTISLSGFILNDNGKVYYYNKGIKLLIKHILFDEYQDFTQGQINIIKEIIDVIPYTVSFDYTQAIYRPVRKF